MENRKCPHRVIHFNEHQNFDSRNGERIDRPAAWRCDWCEQEFAPVPTRCCERDNDGDGNCDIHSAPGVLRERK